MQTIHPDLIHQFHANGKLLISGEYFVLDGAIALALPTKFGQSLQIYSATKDLHWKSFDADQQCWFEAQFDFEDFTCFKSTDESTSNRLTEILNAVRKQAPDFLKKSTGLIVETLLTFPKNWGLGTSSTLIYAIAKWAGIDPFVLLADTFGGSGYDIACAGVDQAILYQRKSGEPTFETCTFNPLFKEQLYFVYLGKKQNSREGIARYRERVKEQPFLINTISGLTKEILHAKSIGDFEHCIKEHERMISASLDLPRAKTLYFDDYAGEVKSLGAWGGDFVLVTSQQSVEKTQDYFNQKGFDICLPYKQMIKE